jgi:hypothetical protein
MSAVKQHTLPPRFFIGLSAVGLFVQADVSAILPL